MTSRRAFTLAESLIVLALVALIVAVTAAPARRGFERVQEDQFWREFKQEWQAAQIRAKVAHQATWVSYEAPNRRVTFVSQGRTRALALPKTLLVRDCQDFYMHPNGYVAPQTWQLVSRLDGREYYLRIQLGWGGYHVEKGPAGRVHFSRAVVGAGDSRIGRGDPLVCPRPGQIGPGQKYGAVTGRQAGEGGQRRAG